MNHTTFAVWDRTDSGVRSLVFVRDIPYPVTKEQVLERLVLHRYLIDSKETGFISDQWPEEVVREFKNILEGYPSHATQTTWRDLSHEPLSSGQSEKGSGDA